ncbi:MAG: flippase-like domain-containing protein [Blastocatellia bacterium]|nr:flippase-like domain-containing protein [Blastocatellia bacterium]
MKKTAITILKIAVSLGLYIYIFRTVDVSKLWDILKDANLYYFAGGVLIYFAIQGISAYRWYLLLGPLGLKSSYTKLFSYYLLGMFFNFFLPTAIGGDVVRVYYLRKDTGTLSKSGASVFLDRDLGMAALLLIATLVALFAGTSFQGVPLSPLFGLIVIAFVATNMVLFYRPTYNLLHRLLAMFRMKRADEKVEKLFLSINSYRRERKLLVVTMALSIMIQVGCIVINKLSADAIGIKEAGWIDFFVFVPAIGLISMMPVSVNGMGWREFSYLVLFKSVGVAEPQAAALAFLWLGVLLATSLPGGIIYLLRGGKRKEDLAASEILEAKQQVSG